MGSFRLFPTLALLPFTIRCSTTMLFSKVSSTNSRNAVIYFDSEFRVQSAEPLYLLCILSLFAVALLPVCSVQVVTNFMYDLGGTSQRMDSVSYLILLKMNNFNNG